MSILQLNPSLTAQLATLYEDMEAHYQVVAKKLNFSCTGCPDNCCDSYFQHHTYIEWAYMWQGYSSLAPDTQDEIMSRAKSYDKQSQMMLKNGQRPNSMCPLNDQGLCGLYSHRYMICRLHGVVSKLTLPDGRAIDFPGCFQCQEINEHIPVGKRPTPLERSGLLKRLADLEIKCIGRSRNEVPKVKLTIAQMLLQGQPRL